MTENEKLIYFKSKLYMKLPVMCKECIHVDSICFNFIAAKPTRAFLGTCLVFKPKKYLPFQLSNKKVNLDGFKNGLEEKLFEG